MGLRDDSDAQRVPAPDAIAPGAVTALLARLLDAPPPDAPAPLPPGARAGRYEILREIGRGGFGIVYEARDAALNRLVALKVLRRTEAADPAAAREGEAAARLAHPNIAAVYDAGLAEDGSPFLVYELLHGETLASRLARGPIPAREAAGIAAQIARALAHAHSHGVVHRDLKPANVFLTADGDVKVLDFGIALLFGRGAPGGGTPAYMAPEQRRGDPEDARTDLFALGVVLREMLDARPDHDGAPGRAVPAPLRRVVDGLLADDPSARPRSARAAVAELEAATRALPRPRARRHRLAAPALAVAAIAAAIAAGVLVRERVQRGAAAPEGPPSSIAVLPFADLSPGRDQEYFSDGLADEVLNALAHVDGLRVAGRTSSFSFKGKADDVRTIGQRLNVGAVLEGSVRKAGNRIRVTAQLVDAANGYHLWSDTYDREVSDVFAVQDDISRAVVQSLKVRLLPGREPTARPHRTANPEVYNHYLLGRQHYYRASQEGFRRAVAEYEQALALDPGYAPAWAGLTIPLYYLANDAPSLERAQALRRRATEAAEKAVSLAPDLADGWAARGIQRATVNRDWRGGRADLEKAVELNPGDPHARRRLSIVLMDVGRLDEALAAAQKAVELDPLSPQSWTQLGLVQSARGENAPSLEAFRRALERAPESASALLGVAIGEILVGRPAAALERLARCGDEQPCLFGKALAEDALGRRRESQRALDLLVERYAHVSAIRIAIVHAQRGDAERALEWLDRAVAQGDANLDAVKVTPLLRPLRGHPRFAAVLRRMNLPAD